MLKMKEGESIIRSLFDYGDKEVEANQNIKFGINISTYHRKDGSTFDSIQKTLESVLNQKYENWHIVLTGDKYEHQEEFDKIVSLVPEDKISAVNLDYALERDMFLNKTINSQGEKILPSLRSLWNVGGLNAFRLGIDRLKELNISHCIHLDHDDILLDNHLHNLYIAYTLYPELSFAFTRSTFPNYAQGSILPPVDENQTGWGINNYSPQPCATVHSTISYNIDKYNEYELLGFNGEHYTFMGREVNVNTDPFDALIWSTFKAYMDHKGLNYFYIPIVTVNKNRDCVNIIDQYIY